MSDAYGDDLAYIHDVGFGEFAQAAAPFLLKVLHRAGVEDGLVVDLGCGSGIWARLLVDAGYEVRGIDLSPAMIHMARMPDQGKSCRFMCIRWRSRKLVRSAG